MSMNKYGGVDDMPSGFTKTPLGRRVYGLWFGMLRRCYDYKQLNRAKGHSYSNVIVCNRWLYLKNFYEDIQKLEGYNEWLEKESMSLDKDIIAQEVTKIYSPQTCKFVTQTENMQEMRRRCNPSKMTTYVLFKGDEYKVFNTEKSACEFLGVRKSYVSSLWKRKRKYNGWNIIRIGNTLKIGKNE